MNVPIHLFQMADRLVGVQCLLALTCCSAALGELLDLSQYVRQLNTLLVATGDL